MKDYGQLVPKKTRTQDKLSWVRVVLGTGCPDPYNNSLMELCDNQTHGVEFSF